MAHFETEKYFESEKQLPKISQSDFAIETDFDVSIDTTELIEHLKNLEPNYREHIVINNGKPDPRVCNEILFSCIQLFSKKFDICVIYSEIIDFFGFDNRLFYNALNIQLKYKLRNTLAQRVSLDTYERLKKKEEAKQGGAYTPSFMDIMLKFKKKKTN